MYKCSYLKYYKTDEVDKIFKFCTRGCKFHIGQAKQRILKSAPMAHREELSFMLSSFFDATSKERVQEMATQIVAKFNYLDSW